MKVFRAATVIAALAVSTSITAAHDVTKAKRVDKAPEMTGTVAVRPVPAAPATVNRPASSVPQTYEPSGVPHVDTGLRQKYK